MVSRLEDCFFEFSGRLEDGKPKTGALADAPFLSLLREIYGQGGILHTVSRCALGDARNIFFFKRLAS